MAGKAALKFMHDDNDTIALVIVWRRGWRLKVCTTMQVHTGEGTSMQYHCD